MAKPWSRRLLRETHIGVQRILKKVRTGKTIIHRMVLCMRDRRWKGRPPMSFRLGTTPSGRMSIGMSKESHTTRRGGNTRCLRERLTTPGHYVDGESIRIARLAPWAGIHMTKHHSTMKRMNRTDRLPRRSLGVFRRTRMNPGLALVDRVVSQQTLLGTSGKEGMSNLPKPRRVSLDLIGGDRAIQEVRQYEMNMGRDKRRSSAATLRTTTTTMAIFPYTKSTPTILMILGSAMIHVRNRVIPTDRTVETNRVPNEAKEQQKHLAIHHLVGFVRFATLRLPSMLFTNPSGDSSFPSRLMERRVHWFERVLASNMSLF